MCKKRSTLTKGTRDGHTQGAGVVLLAHLQSIVGLPTKNTTESEIIILITILLKNNIRNTELTDLPLMRDTRNTRDNSHWLRQVECDCFKGLLPPNNGKTEMVQENRYLRSPPRYPFLSSFKLGSTKAFTRFKLKLMYYLPPATPLLTSKSLSLVPTETLPMSSFEFFYFHNAASHLSVSKKISRSSPTNV